MVRITEQLVRKKSEHNECLISSLEELSLHQEDIERIEHLHNWCRDLKILLLQSNLISKIENLFKLKRLEYLNLAVNNIARVENLEGLESLNKLDLTLNFIGELTSIESLQGNYNLRELILVGNPCCDYPHYKEYVMATLPQLSHLDCTEILSSDKLSARLHLKEYRAVIVQKQTDYVIERDEQKLRVVQQQAELADEMCQVEDEDERLKLFWNTKSEHCPETRNEIAKYHRLCRAKHEPTQNAHDNGQRSRRAAPILFAPCGRAYNLNQAKLPFKFQDEMYEYILELEVYKFLETSLIDVDIEVNYIRVTVKGKVFQLSLNDEVKPAESKVQRSQTTGHLHVNMPKLKANNMLGMDMPRHRMAVANNNKTLSVGKSKERAELKAAVDISSIVSEPDDLPELI